MCNNNKNVKQIKQKHDAPFKDVYVTSAYRKRRFDLQKKEKKATKHAA